MHMNLTRFSRRWSRRAQVTAVLVGVVALGASTLVAAPAVAAAALPDGKTSVTAAASCWEVKQNYPASTDGVYWLVTPALIAPQQFYCDMTTDGGGWVLIARGREGWKGQYNGLRSAVTLRNTPSGTGAFATAQLPGTTVDGLLNDTRPDALPDGVRVRRAMDAAGTQYQEVRFKYANRDRWNWTFGAGQPLASWTIGTASGSGGSSSSFGSDNAYNRVDTSAPQSQAFVGGFAYGASVTGTTSASSYLYSSTDGGGSARPFAQMFLRPKLTLANLTFPTIPDSGSAAITESALPESDAQPTVWGVSGLANGAGGELNTEVAAFGQVGNTVFVGGNFKYVQRAANSTGSDQIQQSYIAGFNVNTGDWVSTFRPVLNGQVKAIAGLPNGKLAIGGQFNVVDGVAQQSMAVLDPVTGAISGPQVTVENRQSGGVPDVRGLTVIGNEMYVAGSFTHLDAAGKSTASDWDGARIDVSTMTPDIHWNPQLNGTSVGVDAAPQGDRAYFAGYFRMSGTAQALSAAAFQTGANAPLATPSWTPTFSTTDGNIWQLGVREAGGHIWLGGSEHSLFAYDRNTFALDSGAITLAGGDFQAVNSTGNIVVGGCHCGDWVYSDAYTWPSPSGFTEADKMNLLGAWNATTGAYEQQFSPILQARAGYGVWALFTDSTGTLWAGGDLSASVKAGEVNQWSGGYVRFAPRDTSAPSTPGGVTVSQTDTTATLSWNASTDDRGVTGYEVLRGGQVIATTTNRTYSVPVGDSATRYFVRAVDAAGNRSASTNVITVSPATTHTTTLVASGSTWSWIYSSATRASDWNTTGFDSSSWATGPAPLGFGTSGLGTDISVGAPSPKPLSAQFRRSFTIADPSVYTNPTVSVIANDGAIVYLNGTELGRANLPTGTIGQNTYATAAPTAAAAAKSPATFPIPAGLLVAGTNVLAVSTHLNYKSTPDVTFDLSLTATTQ
jgi:hypothetical protein